MPTTKSMLMTREHARSRPVGDGRPQLCGLRSEEGLQVVAPRPAPAPVDYPWAPERKEGEPLFVLSRHR